MSLVNMISISLEGPKGRAAREILTRERIIIEDTDYKNLEEVLNSTLQGWGYAGIATLHIGDYDYAFNIATTPDETGLTAEIYPMELLRTEKIAYFLDKGLIAKTVVTILKPAEGPKVKKMMDELETYVKSLGLDYQLATQAIG